MICLLILNFTVLQLVVPVLPEDALLFLLGSCYCETDRLSDTAWRRIGGFLIARGRDAADVPLSNGLGPTILTSFRVWADEVTTGINDQYGSAVYAIPL